MEEEKSKNWFDVIRQIRLHYISKCIRKYPTYTEPWYEKELADRVDRQDIYKVLSYGKFNGTNKPVANAKSIFLVFLDNDLRIRYSISKQDDQDKTENNEEYIKHFSSAITQLRLSETFPIGVLSKDEKTTFKTKLGNGFAAAIKGCYEDIQEIRNNAIDYADRQNRENTKHIIIKTATTIAMFAIILVWLLLHNSWLFHFCETRPIPEWLYVFKATPYGIISFLMGMLGAYASLWSRYNNLGSLSYGSRFSVVCETVCRILFGGLGGFIAYWGIKSGIVMPDVFDKKVVVELIAFVAGFVERFIPNLVNKLSKLALQDDGFDKESYTTPTASPMQVKEK